MFIREALELKFRKTCEQQRKMSQKQVRQKLDFTTMWKLAASPFVKRCLDWANDKEKSQKYNTNNAWKNLPAIFPVSKKTKE